jgi:hypothetical protein
VVLLTFLVQLRETGDLLLGVLPGKDISVLLAFSRGLCFRFVIRFVACVFRYPPYGNDRRYSIRE